MECTAVLQVLSGRLDTFCPGDLSVSHVECGMARSSSGLLCLAVHTKRKISLLWNEAGWQISRISASRAMKETIPFRKVLMSFQNQLEMSKQHVTQPPLYLTLHGHLFPHVGPRDTV